jgi:hypothetical protein
MNFQRVDLYSPMLSSRKGPAPLVIRVGVQPGDIYTEGGALSSPLKQESYVLLSALPDELRRRVEVAVQSILSGM